ncbi:flavin-dependent oxidoreductase [Pseudonocardia sp. Ae406_Ps2]|uniref:LLM class F420-dependent oxidoreductase n=1 Tax=unclassified Pseudonocardia TaxID=2619320 RepID=UPI00094B250F|nr:MULTISPECIES: LLM class F420-dependent oxidoreductase [unclassified Pseudonocardia]OLL99556.1 flavin-dependent oxidoreductase [Pseudonocardia sp. Ae331_Ps2]OLM02703.1 flavin-dependent oxidoreductase [Pseudonocardia sp. Ae406_Ps2]OLM12461.1 flavin-dependent oxidoreductase [Pseudonocardia sp. Ae505_Ps2]OLM24280.1 flavin-dependent oxidoreductase [Pseudonocardia sp. Ae706_Ps2]OLM29786.1 flavin-dependent oxidoreductase [Pseudonocardia sp. Ae717_Ps2]
MSVSLGRYGVWRHETGLSPDLAAEIEKLGFGAVWVGGSPPGDLALAESLLDATTSLAVATGIVNIWATPADEVAESFHRIEARHPGRFLLGIGVGHPEATSDYTRPYAALVAYLDRLDELEVPTDGRAVAALGPKMLDLARDRSAGTHPYLTTPEHTRSTRERYGAGALIAPEHKVVLDDDPAAARTLGRPAVEKPYLSLVNYRNNLKRLGWAESDLDDGGSDALIDALVAHGTPEQVAARLDEHLDAGADHVCAQLITPGMAEPEGDLRRLATALGLASAG